MIYKIKLTICLFFVMVSGCASTDNKPALSDVQNADDPYMGWNRGVFAFNSAVDEYALAPASKIYGYVTPKVVRYIVTNEIDYLQSPISIINSALQGDWDVFKHTTARFFINTTVGGLGLLDPATEFGFKPHYEDFGQTLAVWGVDDGMYYMAPFIGPLTLRDVGGKMTDLGFSPFTYMDNTAYITSTKIALDLLEFRERNFDTIEGLKSSSEDYYAAVRSIYLQKRNSDIMNDDINTQNDFIDFDAK